MHEPLKYCAVIYIDKYDIQWKKLSSPRSNVPVLTNIIHSSSSHKLICVNRVLKNISQGHKLILPQNNVCRSSKPIVFPINKGKMVLPNRFCLTMSPRPEPIHTSSGRNFTRYKFCTKTCTLHDGISDKWMIE